MVSAVAVNQPLLQRDCVMNLLPPADIVKSDIELACKHIELLTGDPNSPCHWRLLHDSRKNDPEYPARNRFGTVTDLWPEFEQAQSDGYGVFVVVNAGGHSDTEIESIRAVFIDGDDKPMPSTWHCMPSFFVQRSATRWHVYWVMHGMRVDDFKPAQLRLAAHYGTDTAVCNPSRVMRLAGTLHLKVSSNPQLMQLEIGGGWDLMGPYETREVLTDLATVAVKLAEPRGAAPGVTVDHPDNVRRYAVYLQGLVAQGKVAIEGQKGDNHTLQVGMKGMDLGCSTEKVHALMLTHFNTHCVPPWDADELAVKVINAANSRKNAFGSDAVNPSAEEFGNIVKNANTQPAATGEDLPLLEFESGDRLLDEEPEPIEWLIDGLVEKGEAVMLSGPGGVHKSRTAMHWGLAISEGEPIYGRKTERAAFVYLSYEDVRKKVKNRMHLMTKRLGGTWGSNMRYRDMTDRSQEFLLGVTSAADLSPQPLYFQLRKYLQGIAGHKFVVLDSTYNVVKFSGNAKIDDGAVNEAVKFLRRLGRETNSTVMFLWHPSYSGQSRGDNSGWSTAWNDAPRAKLSLSRPPKGKDGKHAHNGFDLTVEKASDGPTGSVHTLYWADGVLLPVSGSKITNLMEACVKVATLAADKGVPIVRRRAVAGWVIDAIEAECGDRPVERQILEMLEDANQWKRLCYIKAKSKTKAGFYPFGAKELPSGEIMNAPETEFDPERNYRISEPE